MKKRLLALLTALCLIFGMIPAVSAAVTDSGTCGENVTWSYDEATGSLTISGEGPMANYESFSDIPWCAYSDSLTGVVIEKGVTAIGDRAFWGCEKMTSISIPEGITRIGSHAISGCYTLKSIALPEGITEIADHAFFGSDALTTLNIPESVVSIGDRAFSNCESLVSLTIPEGITAIGEHTFSWCTSLTSVSLPDTVTAIGDSAFFRCHKLAGIDIPEKVVSIGEMAFYACCNLTELTIPNNVTSIGYQAFAHCTGLSTMTIPASVTSVADGIFAYCTGLEKILADGKNAHFSNDQSGVLYSKDQAELIQAPGAISGSYGIPSTVTAIRNEAFAGCSGLTGVSIPDSVAAIGAFAFESSGLKEIVIGRGVTSIDQYAFAYCENLSCATISDSVTAIGYRAFRGCPVLKEIRFLGDAPTIGSENFGDVTAVCYYPAGSDTWTADVMQSYGGTITWTAYDPAEEPTNPSEPEETEPANPIENPFTDVKSSAYYYDPVLWAVEHQITGGTSATTFSPNASCTRGQIVTFLWAANGRPEPKTDNNPFRDVKKSAYYYKAVLWAVENGITSGTSATTFSPNAACTRAQVVTFLWAANGRPDPESTKNGFSDVKSGAYYDKPVLWAVENGITSGVGGGKFGPGQTCTRGQIVTFLYKAYKDII